MFLKFFLVYKEPFSYNVPLLDIALMSLDINFSIMKTKKKNIRSKNVIFNKKVMYKDNEEKDLVGIYMK